jgi:hypothetical protein
MIIYLKKYILLFLVCLGSFGKIIGQTPLDAQMMSKGSACFLAQYSNNSWKEYWENKLLRDNPNLGTVTNQSAMLMGVAGLGHHLNLFVGVPYITTNPSQGSFKGQKGLQDISAILKYRIVNKPIGFNLFATIGGSIPTNKYVADYMPFSIGNGCKTASARLIANVTTKSGIYLTTSGGYTLRSNITIDKDSYQAFDKVYNTNVVPVPNNVELNARLGFVNKMFQIEAFADKLKCLSGDNIRRNDMPFPTNGMNEDAIGAFIKYHPKALGLQASYRKTLNGLNIGKSTTYAVGLLYQFKYAK